MGVTTFTQDHTAPFPPAKMFQTMILEFHTLLQKALPQEIKSVDLEHGQWGSPGCISKTTFNGGFVKYRTDVIDKDNLRTKYVLIDGDVVGDKVESVVYELKVEPSGSGCILKLTTNYHTKGDHKLSPEEIAAEKEKNIRPYKTLVDYLLANPSH